SPGPTRQDVGDFGLASPRGTFEQQWSAHAQRQKERRGERIVGQVAGLGENLGHLRGRRNGEGHVGDQTPAFSSARRTRTFATCWRYATDPLKSAEGSVPSAASCAASAAFAPDATAASTARARIGTGPMLMRPTPTPLLVRTASAPTIAQSIARFVSFSNPHSPSERGTRTSTSSSSGLRATSKKLRKKSFASISRRPFGPWTTRVPPRASTAAGKSEAGSPWAIDPPIV